jgi:glycosyltransferase involved in cell wall biosynthesis
MSKQPFFSVVIPLYNKEDYIESTIKSVLNQSFQNFEIIVVNDGSTDSSKNIVEKINDSRITVFSNKNIGLSFSRNFGIKKAKAKYIAFLDADDLWLNDFLQTIFNLIERNKNEYVFATNLEILAFKKKPIITSSKFNTDDELLMTNYFKVKKNIFGPSSLVINKCVCENVGYFNEKINYGEGEDFFIRCFSYYSLVYYKNPKALYRTGIPNQLTAPNKNSNRIIPNYELYLKNNSNKDLKKYIDFIHYKLVLLYKMEKNFELVKFYKKKISVSNLSGIQKIKYYLPIQAFYLIKSIHIWFSKRFIQA